jgi:hypothetical protein
MKGIMRVLMRVMSKMMISCEKAAFLASKSLDTRLSLSETMAMKMHTMVCKYCKMYSIEISEINHAIQHINHNVESGNFQYELSDADKDSLEKLVESNTSSN